MTDLVDIYKDKTLLVSLAHPDDESFGSGGTLAHYARLGARVVLICATSGDVGEISHESLATPTTLSQVRLDELRCACRNLGIEDLYLLGYRDSGMMGTPANEHPASLYQADPEEVVGKIVEIVRQVKPQVMVTFDEKGGYGHPDHLVVHQATVAAFAAAADPTRFPAQVQAGLVPHQAQKLYYTALPRSLFEVWAAAMAERGINVRQFGANRDLNMEEMGVPDERVTTRIPVSEPALDAHWAAIQCHQTQIPADSPFRVIPEAEMRQSIKTEYFILAQGQAAGLPEEDLFAGVV